MFQKGFVKNFGSSVLLVEGNNFIKIKSSTCGKFQTCRKLKDLKSIF
ncbi:MAG: hypothetical protein RLZZ628_1179 [Bacteroidota bacterium]|jgi:hypothetical protein